jgi:uncharacterized protein YndB with AHSA1/START domain
MHEERPDPGRLAASVDEGLGRRLSVDVERTVDAPIDVVWSVLCDYEYARPRMLPEHFVDYVIRDGGQGVGTVIAYLLRVGRRERRFQATVAEPMPGRQLRERDHRSGLVVTWTLTPGGDGERTVVRLAVQLRDPDSHGWLGHRRTRRALRRAYDQLLARLDSYLRTDRSRE